jgi:hypothetical protein
MTTGDRLLQGLTLAMVGHIAVNTSTAGRWWLLWLGTSVVANFIWLYLLLDNRATKP